MKNKFNWKVGVCSTLAMAMMLTTVGCGGQTGSNGSSPAPTATASADATPAAGSGEWKPTEPVNMIVPFSAGGSSDILARLVEKVWSKYCDQQLLVVNKPGGGGVEGATTVARSKPDGHTFVIGVGSGHDLVMPHIQKVEYNPFEDLLHVARLSVHSVAVAVPAKSEFNSVKDIVDWAKAQNKPVTASVSTTAGSVDIVMRGIGVSSGITVTPVPHAGGSQAITTLVGGQTLIGGGHPTEIQSQLKAGNLRAVAIATPERDPVMPDVPTLIEQGINFSTWGSVKGVGFPKETPPEVVKYYEDLFKKISEDEDFKTGMANVLQPVMYQNSEDFTKFMKQAFDDYGKLVEELGLKPQ